VELWGCGKPDKVRTRSKTMLMNMYVVYDRVAKESGPVFEAKNDDVALRKLRHEFESAKVDIQDDMKLYRVGIIDHEINTIVTVETDPVEIYESLE
jgi:uncharacterized protein YehS (DUF1456 family)